ncbi:MAG TPA: hypothetical protein VH325_10300 [Bryobacteraceae bacterium]|jgi:flagellar capping protein FliD|nr:hypothetical protein [Bryobacteraceae bacterium]
MPDNSALQVFYGSIAVMATILMAVFVAVFTNNKRMDDLRDTISNRITDLKTSIESRFAMVDSHFAAIENRLTSIESRLSEVEKSQRVIR